MNSDVQVIRGAHRGIAFGFSHEFFFVFLKIDLFQFDCVIDIHTTQMFFFSQSDLKEYIKKRFEKIPLF